jgi:nucleotide-binding universal stress UspA family protein
MQANESEKGPEATQNSASLVLLCFDGSDGSREAIRYAGTALESKNALVVSVWEQFNAWFPYDPLALGSSVVTGLGHDSLGLDKIAEEAGKKVLHEGMKLAKDAGFEVGGRIAEGTPWRAIVEVAEEENVSMIVVGARGLSRTSSLLLGSVTMGVIHHTEIPTLVVHEKKPVQDN